MMNELAADERTSSEGCRQAAEDYITGNTAYPGAPLLHLFKRDYGGKKLVLFWDEFDKACAPEGKGLISTSLRGVQNRFKTGKLPSFQSVVFFGSYNANLVTSMGGPQFIYGSIHSHEYLDFSLDETRELFGQYQEEYKVEVSTTSSRTSTS